MKIITWKRKVAGRMDRAVLRGKDKVVELMLKKRDGIDGILVTVGLCIIALLLCVVMKDSLTTFITTIVSTLQAKAISILG